MHEIPDFAPLSDDCWPATIADLKDGFAGGLNVYRTMAHHPELLRAWSGLRDHVVNRTALGASQAEVVILRASTRLGADYEWSQHILRGRKAGLTDARIRSVKGPYDVMEPKDALLCRAVDELFDRNRLSPETAGDLTAEIGKTGVLDLIATVGFYSTLGFMLNSFEVPLDADAALALEAQPLAD